MHLRAHWFALFALSLTVAFTGCEGSHGEHEGEHEGETHTGVEEACEHAAEGPFEDVTATADAAGAPSATFEHTAVHITLVEDPDNAGNHIGNVTYAADEATEFAFFLSADIPFVILDSSDTEVALEESADVTQCAEVAKEHAADLEVGTYTLWFGPTTETMVTLVVEEAAHEGDEHDSHDHDADEHDDH